MFQTIHDIRNCLPCTKHGESVKELEESRSSSEHNGAGYLKYKSGREKDRALVKIRIHYFGVK